MAQGRRCSRALLADNSRVLCPFVAKPKQTPSSSFSLHPYATQLPFFGFANIVQRWTAAVARLPCATTIGTSSSSLKTRTSPSRSTGLLATSRVTKVSPATLPHYALYSCTRRLHSKLIPPDRWPRTPDIAHVYWITEARDPVSHLLTPLGTAEAFSVHTRSPKKGWHEHHLHHPGHHRRH